LLGLLAAWLTLFVAYPDLREPYNLPEVRLVLDTVVMLAALVVAVLAAIRVSVEGRWSDVLLCLGFSLTAASNLAFAIVPAFDPGNDLARPEGWAGVGGRIAGAAVIALAPFVRRRTGRSQRALTVTLSGGVIVLAALWAACTIFSTSLPPLAAGLSGNQPMLRTAALAVQALLGIVALLGFWRRYRAEGEDLDRWLALAATPARSTTGCSSTCSPLRRTCRCSGRTTSPRRRSSS
jgi:hypothetical protein